MRGDQSRTRYLSSHCRGPLDLTEILQLKYKKTYDNIFLNSNVSKYLPQLKTYLTNNKVDFSDPHLYQIHFQNGFWNFKTNTFEKREIGKHYINYYIK